MREKNNQRIRFFLDTNILISAVRPEESGHTKAEEFFRIVKENNGIFVTSSLVMSELFIPLFNKGLDNKTIREFCENLIDAENFIIINISDSQIAKVLSKMLESGIKLKSSDLYISATAIYFDTIFLTLDDQIYRNVSEIYENTFNDPKF